MNSLEKIAVGTQVVARDFVPGFDQEELKELETFVGSRAGLRLYIGPDGIVERIQIRAVRGLFERGDETG